MSGVASNRVVGSARGVGLIVVGALAWALFAPGGLFWMAVLATSLVGSVVAAAILFRIRSTPTLAEVIATAECAPLSAPVAVETWAKQGFAREG